MKYKLIICCLALFAINKVTAQKKGNAKVYAYMQPVVSGVSPQGEIYPDGAVKNTTNTERANYWLYISYNSSSSKIYPTEIWINGERFGVKADPVTKTPVTYTSTDPAETKEIILVPKTSSKVLMLTKAPAGKPILKNTSIAKKAAVVVVYKYEGNFYYATLPQIKKLNKAFML